MLKEFHSRWTELTLLIMAAAVFTITLVSLELSQGNELTTEILWIIGGFLGVLIGAHIVLCFLAPHSDQLMLPIVAVLNGIGLLMLARIDIAQETTLASRQVMWTIVGLVLFAAVLIIVRDHKVFTRFSYLLGVVGIVLLALPWCGRSHQAQKPASGFGWDHFPFSRVSSRRFCCFCSSPCSWYKSAHYLPSLATAS